MKSLMILLFTILAIVKLNAQETSNPDLQGLVNAERAFISMAKEKNTRDAFMTYLADDAVTFGKEARIGKEHLKAQAPNDSWLFWEPVYSDISASGDFGFNTGPWEFKSKRTDEKAVAFGQFVTVWTKINGEWKAAIDIGISHETPKRHEQWRTSSISLPSNSKSKSGSSPKKEIVSIEKDFLRSFSQLNYKAYKDYLSEDARVYRGGSEPVISASVVKNFVDGTNQDLTFTPIGGLMSSAGDMAFVYGKTIRKELQNGESKEIYSSYMRIWKKEGGSWKIVLDIIQ